MRQEAFDRADDGHRGALWVDPGLKRNCAVYSNQQVASSEPQVADCTDFWLGLRPYLTI